MITLVPITGLRSNRRRGLQNTRDRHGKPFPYSELQVLAGGDPWLGTPGTVRDLHALDQAVRKEGSQGIRLVEVYRPHTHALNRAVQHIKWVNAGRPDTDSPEFHFGMRVHNRDAPGDSHHEWGAAVDIDVHALDFPGAAPDEQLACLWELATPLGFRPVITRPNVAQAESGHFDHIEPLLEAMAYSHEDPTIWRKIAHVGCILTGRMRTAQTAHVLQARLNLCGLPVPLTGKLDSATRGGASTLVNVTAKDTAITLLAKLDAMGAGEALAARL